MTHSTANAYYEQNRGAWLCGMPAGEELSFEQFADLFSRPAFPSVDGEGDCVGFAARDTSGAVTPFRFARR